MRVTKAGTLPGARLWRGKCQNCHTEFEAREDELTQITPVSQRNDVAFAHEECSFCGSQAGVILHQTDDVADPTDPVTDTDRVARIRAAIQEYYAALNAREHGGVAQGNALQKIERLLGLSWKQ